MMPPPDETTVPDPRSNPRVQQIVNTGGGGIFDGIYGWWKLATAISFAAIVGGSFLFLQWVQVQDARQHWSEARQDRQSDQQQFRDAWKAMQDETTRNARVLNDEQNRRAAEMIATLNYNSGKLVDLIAEMRSAKRDGRPVPQSAMPKATPP